VAAEDRARANVVEGCRCERSSSIRVAMMSVRLTDPARESQVVSKHSPKLSFGKDERRRHRDRKKS
jgi:hypothetical protein